ncbi:hypothetical protein JW877_07430 [bacterium]|nr:hypothetical protein [bacterium]
MENSKYVQGIYDYCDRWCENCRFSDRCLLYKHYQQIVQEHLSRGDDPGDPESIKKDLSYNFQETINLIKQNARDQGINLDDIPETKFDKPGLYRHPLFQMAYRYYNRARKFLSNYRSQLENYGLKLTEYEGLVPLPEDEYRDYDELVKAFRTVSWYHTLISVKLYRALCNDFGDFPDDNSTSRHDDALGSAKVAFISAEKSFQALNKIYHWAEGMALIHLKQETLLLMGELESLTDMIDQVFPGHKDFKRPGLDD